MKLAKIGLISVAGFVLLALIGLGLIGWLLGTERGTAWAIATAQSRAPIEVSIGDVQGTLLDGVVLNDGRRGASNIT